MTRSLAFVRYISSTEYWKINKKQVFFSRHARVWEYFFVIVFSELLGIPSVVALTHTTVWDNEFFHKFQVFANPLQVLDM